jgi:hypothetical protein
MTEPKTDFTDIRFQNPQPKGNTATEGSASLSSYRAPVDLLPSGPPPAQPVPSTPPRSLQVFGWINLIAGVCLPILNFFVVNHSIEKLHGMGLSDTTTAPLWIVIWMYAATGLVMFVTGIGLCQQTLWGRKLALICAVWYFIAVFASLICGSVTMALVQEEYHGPYTQIQFFFAAPMLTPLYGIITLVSLNLPPVRRWARGVRAVNRGVPPAEAFAPVAEPPVSKLAVTSMICSVIPCMLVTQVVALITGIIALRQIKKSNGTLGGRGMALAGTIISSIILGLLGSLIAFAIVMSQIEDKKRTQPNQEREEMKVIHYP